MELKDFFAANPKVAVGFSGGVDSAYLLYEASRYAKEVKAYYLKSQFQPAFELADAQRLASALGVSMEVLTVDILSNKQVKANGHRRCYYCKQSIFSAISEAALRDGFSVLLDGTNASDDAADRPGFAALQELHVLSPLRLCGLTKEEIRKQSKEAGLFTWDKPSYSCLATRIAVDEELTDEKLAVTEEAEQFLFSLGFSDFRVRQKNGCARLEIKKEQIPLAEKHRDAILQQLRQLYPSVTEEFAKR